MPGPTDPEAAEPHSLRGPTDRGALLDIRELFEREEPLASGTLDDYLDPRTLRIDLADGIGDADTARIDVVWTVRDDYAFHYTDSAGVDCRWDAHPHGGAYGHASGRAHFHPPPDASNDPADVQQSCIRESTVDLVARAVRKLWRAAYHRRSVVGINSGSNPP